MNMLMDADKLADAFENGGAEALEKLAMESENPPADPPPSSTPATDATPPDETGASSSTTQTESEPEIAMPSGKGTIPYAELKRARAQASEAKQQVAFLQEQLAMLQEQQGDTQAPEAPATQPDAIGDQIAQLLEKAETYEDFPEIAEGFKQSALVMQALREQLREVAGKAAQAQATIQETEAKTVQEQVQEAIDSVPTLRLWQAEHPTVFDRAAAIDRAIRDLPEWADKPMADRFKAVAAMVVAGDPAVPQVAAAKAPTPVVPLEPELKPFTLSDIPGGMPPARDMSEQLGDLTGAQLTNKFLNMSPEQINDYLATLGT